MLNTPINVFTHGNGECRGHDTDRSTSQEMAGFDVADGETRSNSLPACCGGLILLLIFLTPSKDFCCEGMRYR